MAPRTFRHILTANAIFSLSSGLLMILFPNQLSGSLNLTDTSILLGLGIGIAGFGVHLFRSSRRASPNFLELKYFATMDALWVLGSIALLLTVPIPSFGFWLIISTALIVGDFGILEILGIRSLARSRNHVK